RIKRFDSDQVILLIVIRCFSDAFEINKSARMDQLSFEISFMNIAKKALCGCTCRWIAKEQLLPVRVMSRPQIRRRRFSAAATGLDKRHTSPRLAYLLLKGPQCLMLQPRPNDSVHFCRIHSSV